MMNNFDKYAQKKEWTKNSPLIYGAEITDHHM